MHVHVRDGERKREREREREKDSDETRVKETKKRESENRAVGAQERKRTGVYARRRYGCNVVLQRVASCCSVL